LQQLIKRKKIMKKMKLFMTVLIAVLTTTAAVAQRGKSSSVNSTDVKGKTFINAGIGIGTFGFNGTGGLPIGASIEHGFTDKISGGIYVGFVQTKYTSSYKYKYTVAGVRASYHFNEALNVANPKLDLYGGASIYYRGYTLKYESAGVKEKATGSTVGFALHAGCHYMFADKIGAFAELGWGISPLQLGVAFIF
jgi:hypothetical protein